MSILRSPFSGKKNPKKKEKPKKVEEAPPAASEPVEVIAEKEAQEDKRKVEKARVGKKEEVEATAKKVDEKTEEEEKKKVEKKEAVVKKRRFGIRLKIPFPHFHLSIAIVFSLLFLGGIVFTSDKLNSLSQEAEQSRSQLTALRELELSLKELSQNLQSVEKEIAIINQALPNEKTIIQFIKEFKEIDESVSIETFNFETDQPNKDKAGNFYIDLSVKLKGDFTALKDFLVKFVKLSYLVKLELVDIEKAGGGEAQMILKARIFVDDSFFQPEGD